MPKDNKAIHSNKQFIVGNGLLAFGVFFIVVLFLYLAFRGKKKENAYPETFAITLHESITPDSISVLINDSLILRTRIHETTLLRVQRFSESSMLMIVNNQTQEASSYNLDPLQPKVVVRKGTNQRYDFE